MLKAEKKIGIIKNDIFILIQRTGEEYAKWQKKNT